jgi:uncharacterized iron-regulated membrane protein
VRRLILKLHLWLAMIAGAFMVILGITGSVIAFEPELDRLVAYLPSSSPDVPAEVILSSGVVSVN